MSTLDFAPAVELLGHWAPTVEAKVVDEIAEGSLVTPLEAADDADAPAIVERMLTAFLDEAPDERTGALIAAIAEYLSDLPGLSQVTTTTPGELRVVTIDSGTVLGVALTPATPTGPPDPVERLRLACGVLGEYVWLNNNERLDVDVSAERHGLTDLSDFPAWWPGSTTADRLLGHLWDEPGPPVPVDAGAWSGFCEWFHEHNDAGARSGLWAMELLSDDELGDPEARYPGDRLVRRLGEEVLGGARELAGADVSAVYGIGVPLPEDDDYGVIAAVMFVGRETVGVLTVSAAV